MSEKNKEGNAHPDANPVTLEEAIRDGSRYIEGLKRTQPGTRLADALEVLVAHAQRSPLSDGTRGWKLAADHTPPYYTEVLVWFRDGATASTGQLCPKPSEGPDAEEWVCQEQWRDDGPVTHWMSLPEAPK